MARGRTYKQAVLSRNATTLPKQKKTSRKRKR